MADSILNNGSYEIFDYEKFCEEHKRNRKKRVFLNYVEEKFGSLDKRNVLVNLNSNDVIESLQRYISVGGQSQTTARNYFSYISMMFEELSRRYNIKNELFIDKEKYRLLKNEIETLVSTLKETNSKDVASDDEFETMQDEVEKVEYWLKQEEMNKRLIDSDVGRVKNYSKMLSVIAMNLVLDYGFKGNVLTTIRHEQYHEDTNILEVNGIIVPLREKYARLMNLYQRARMVILKANDVQSEMLFVNKAGRDFVAKRRSKDKDTRAPQYGALFCIADELVGSVAMERYAANRIVKMIARGIDLNTIMKLTGFGMNKVFDLQEYYNVEVKELNPSDYFSTSEAYCDEMQYTEEKVSYLKCPVCQRLVTAEAKEWVVVTYENSQKPVLSCRYCGGVYEESSI